MIGIEWAFIFGMQKDQPGMDIPKTYVIKYRHNAFASLLDDPAGQGSRNVNSVRPFMRFVGQNIMVDCLTARVK